MSVVPYTNTFVRVINEERSKYQLNMSCGDLYLKASNYNRESF